MIEIKIKDLRGVGDVELQLDDSKRVFVFFGSNGVGKTKTLESLFIFLLAKTPNFIRFFQYIPQKRIAEKIEVEKEFLDFKGKGVLLTDDSIDYNQLFKQINSQDIDAIAFLGASERSAIYRNDSNATLNHEQISVLIQHSINNQLLSNFNMKTDIHRWFTERAKSVNPYQKEEDNRKVDIDTVLNALHILDNRIEKTLKIDGDGNVFLTVEGQERELSELSSGFISVVKIIQSIISAYSAFTNATDLLNVKGVVLIDEIESHLHIEWQTKIVPTLKKLFPNTTFYIATHSPLVLSQLGEGEAYLLKREKDGVVRSEKINSPNTRLLENVLQDAFDVDLNELKRENMEHIDQSNAKQKLLKLLNG